MKLESQETYESID